MTFKKLAELVAEDFQKTMNENGFETFNEMRRTYEWEMQDIKDEVSSIIDEIAENERSEGRNTDIYMWDDCSTVQIGFSDMSWGNFKKLIFSEIK